MEKRSYSLKELCQAADVTERTVRFYIQEGLLPPPTGAGPFSRYNYEHWLRLQFIKRLKDEFLPLAQIKNLLVDKSPDDLQQLAEKSGLLGNQRFLAEGDMRMENWLTGSNTLRQQLQETPAVYDYKSVDAFSDIADIAEEEDRLLTEEWQTQTKDVSYSSSSLQPPPPQPAKPARGSGNSQRTPRPMISPPPSPPVSSGPVPVPPTIQLAAAPESSGIRREARFSPMPGSISFEPVSAFEADDVPLPAPTPVIPTTNAVPESLAKADIGEDELATTKAEAEVTAKQKKVVAPLAALELESELAPALGELWEKITLAPGVELYVERQIAAGKQNELQKIIEQAKQLLKETS